MISRLKGNVGVMLSQGDDNFSGMEVETLGHAYAKGAGTLFV